MATLGCGRSPRWEIGVQRILDKRGKSEVVSSDITHGDVANLVDDYCLFADDKQNAMCRSFAGTVQHLSQLNWQELAFAGQCILQRINIQ